MLRCSVSFLFYECLALNVRTRIVMHVRDVGERGICIVGGSVLVFVSEISETVLSTDQYSIGSFATFLSLFSPLDVFGDDDS